MKHPCILRLYVPDVAVSFRADEEVFFCADEEGIRADEEGIRADVEDVEGIRAHVEGIRADVEGIRADVEGIRADTQGCTYGPPYLTPTRPALLLLAERRLPEEHCGDLEREYNADHEGKPARGCKPASGRVQPASCRPGRNGSVTRRLALQQPLPPDRASRHPEDSLTVLSVPSSALSALAIPQGVPARNAETPWVVGQSRSEKLWDSFVYQKC
ncbi:hypothetical protein Bbelb_382020 [Branchiostoma belcheri]|nr:hypothetical protein Bbelb_382020 [Branchiostoma belcheri]